VKDEQDPAWERMASPASRFRQSALHPPPGLGQRVDGDPVAYAGREVWKPLVDDTSPGSSKPVPLCTETAGAEVSHEAGVVRHVGPASLPSSTAQVVFFAVASWESLGIEEPDVVQHPAFEKHAEPVGGGDLGP